MIYDKAVEWYEWQTHHFLDRLTDRIISAHVVLDAQHAHTEEPVAFAKRLELEYEPIVEGTRWGDVWDSAWFHLTGTVPAEWKGKRVVAQLDFNGEGLVFDADGVPSQAISNGSVFKHGVARDIYPLYDEANGGEPVDLWIDAAANALFGASLEGDPTRNQPIRIGRYEGKVNKMRLCVLDQELWHLLIDMRVLYSLMKGLEQRSVRRARVLKGLSEAVAAFGDDPANATKCREMLAPLFEKPANASALTVIAVGHAHIDTGWLWPVREGRRKCARTFASQIGLIEKYPEFVFGASQAQHYAFVKEEHPGLYAKIKKAVAAGQWEPQGGMWVEADCNIISGESMVRQFVHGKNFFMDEFGIDVKNTWIPDVFGYSAAMPQIMKRAGVNYFLTQKISWNRMNKFPYNTFMWRGIDGSEVLAHFPPENNYNSSLEAAGLHSAEERYNERGIVDEFMSLFGIGDGGGGPNAEFIERGLRQKDLEGAPKLRFGRADEFFERMSKHADELPRWVGELYLELHRATYTTQSRTKRGNRKLELKLRDTEYLASLAPSGEYPREVLDGIWKNLLMNQFHDILPGSSIGWVYKVAEKEYADAIAKCNELQEKSGASIFQPAEDGMVLVNTLSYPYSGCVELPSGWNGAKSDDEALPAQKDPDGRSFVSVEVPPQGILTLRKTESAPAAAEADGLILENDLIRYEFADDGQLTSAFDKEAGREVLAPGSRANVMTLYEDRPIDYDAWDIDLFYEDMALECARTTNLTKLGSGAVRQGLRFEYEIGESKIGQEIVLGTGSKRLDFATRVSWHERHRMLRVAFPVDVRNDEASFDIQYGFAKRSTHRNTDWDIARFEVAAQRYADLSGAGYGVALLNDCKYGYKIFENTIDLNLLRSSTNPDSDADQGEHEFTYSLLPHKGSLVESDVMREAAMLNSPPISLEGYAAGDVAMPCTVSGDGVTLEVLKKAEKGEGLVVRIVETKGTRTTAELALADPSKRLVETDLLEWCDNGSLDGGCVEMGPFEIRTFKII